tara:strand:+ start:808 stop:1017 length:210 start_codon:yes stop_codon:yes gene_type:complete
MAGMEYNKKSDSKSIKVRSEYTGSLRTNQQVCLTDELWECSCGAFNAAYNKECGKCNTVKPTGKWGRRK